MDHRCLYKTKIKSLETRKAERKVEQQKNRNIQRTERFTISRNISNDEKSPVVSKVLTKQIAFLKKFDDWRIRKQKLKENEQKQKRKPAFSSAVPSGKFVETKNEFRPVLFKKPEFKPIDWTSVRNKENTIKKIEVPKTLVKNSPKLKKMIIKAKKENQTQKINDWKTNIEASKKLKKTEAVFQVPKIKVVKRKKLAPLHISNTENLFTGIGLLTSTNRKQEATLSKDRLDVVNSSLFEGVSPIENSQSIINLHINDPIETMDLSPIENTEEIGMNTTFEKVDEIDLNTTPLNTSVNNKYLSPFVTTARGKGSVKRERVKRQSVYKPNADLCDDEETIANHRCKETANYFKNVLEKEILRLNERCNKWELFKQENEINIPEECKDMIDVAIGQTRLLINKKFQQFRGLIVQCETLSGDNRVLPEDLEGFWDMIYKQAENLDERYEKLEKLKNNEWEDPDSISTEQKKKNGAVKKRVKKSKNNDGLMKLIRMGQKSVQERQRLEKENREKLMDSNRISTPGRKSLLVSVISSEARKTFKQSSIDLKDNSLRILSKTNNVKNGSPPIMNQSTSKKSILKKERNANRKTVFFNDETCEKDEITPPNKQSRKVFKATPKETSIVEIMESPMRRSMRTPKPKISFCDANHDTPCSTKKTYAQTPVNKKKYSISEDTPNHTPRRNSIMTAGGLFMEDEMDTPLSTRQSLRRSARRSQKLK